ncbi:MAG TPA: putative inorganic carbon transporter subunit DabA, partial [Verrucomicrobiae bacterium]|nr:putative inorganic carbon transporter subunit DabA [Verrucomicrobiae bacterium]
MMNATLVPEIPKVSRPLCDIVDAACKRIPPLWPLRNFVAVNPFLGLAGCHFAEAALLIQKAGHGEMLMPARFYLEQIGSGRIRERDIQAAIRLAEKTLPPEWAQEISFASLEELKMELNLSSQPAIRILTFADFLEGQQQTGWPAFVVEEISKWCLAYFDQGQSSWRMPWRGLG